MIKTIAKIFLLCFAAGLAISSAVAQEPAAPEYKVKAAFLFKFIKFVKWPPRTFPEKTSPYVIGVLGDDPFFDAHELVNYLDQVTKGKIINERKILIRRSQRSIAELKNCHLVFINKSARNRFKNILAIARQNNILTVSETENFCEQGGIINFIEDSGKVSFEINPGAAEQSHLKVSSKLLNVARIVATQPR